MQKKQLSAPFVRIKKWFQSDSGFIADEVTIYHPRQVKPSEKGQSIVELALSITILMALLAATVDLGRAFFTWLAMRDSAQEGASYATIAPPSTSYTCNPASPTQICKRTWDGIKDTVANPETHIVVIVTIDQACLGGTVQIDEIYPTFTLAMPFFAGRTIPIHATVNDTVLKPLCP